MVNPITDKAPFQFLLEQFVTLYIQEYGEAKSKEIAKIVHNSNKVKNFIRLAESKNIQPIADDYIRTIHSIIQFTFSKAEHISTACIVLLCKWELEIGKPQELANEKYLNKIFFEILQKCDGYKTHFTSSPNFFEKVHARINTALNKNDAISKIEVDDLLIALTISNNKFKEISPAVEEYIFHTKLLSPEVPLEYQEREINIYSNFSDRFLISSGIIGVSIIEYAINHRFPENQTSLIDFKEVVLKNILQLRNKVLQTTPSGYFKNDIEKIIEASAELTKRFNQLITDKAKEIDGSINQKAEIRNIYYFFNQGIGQILPDKNGVFYSPKICPLIDNKINEIAHEVGLYLFAIPKSV